MESVDAIVGDSIESDNDNDNDSTLNSTAVNDVRSQNSHMSNRLSAQTKFMNNDRKRSISSNQDTYSNNENVVSRSSFSSEDGSRRPHKQEVRQRSQSNFTS